MALPRTKTSGSAFMAVMYVTVGAIMCVWSGLWYWFQQRHQSGSDNSYFWCYGFFLTGLALLIIGLALGRIGRQARHAEAPPDATPTNAPPPVATAPAPVAMPSVPMQAPVAPVAPRTAAQPVVANPSSYQPR
jgi:hypothetical protein